MKTIYHAKYLATKLSLQSPKDEERYISQTVYNSSIELNPHQIKGALFAFKSPISNGVILADEVGLGKTIEAGLVIAQYWSEMKREILIIAPPALTKQWQVELFDKFGLESEIIDAKAFNAYEKNGMRNPFQQKNKILITTYAFARNRCDKVQQAHFKLAVLDEAHKLKNPETKTTKALKEALKNVKKVLLTATPLQNTIDDLYTLCSIIDEKAFGGKNTFDYLYNNDRGALKKQMNQYVNRTLREDVKSYVKYPKREVKTFSFKLTEEEALLYNEVTKFIQNDVTDNGPLVPMLILKKMGSSNEALRGILTTLKSNLLNRHEEKLEKRKDELLKSLVINDEENEEELKELLDKTYPELAKNEELIKEEIKKYTQLIEYSQSVNQETKASELLRALSESFRHLENTEGANRKVLIFTESRKTQDYLYNFLIENGYSSVIRYSGENKTPEAQEAYAKYISNFSGTVKESKNTLMRKALVYEFEHNAEIMIATESAAEGLNLQFCSTIINYDLPWNPQRIEQRIGRCHRYGQPCDVVVINFLNCNNLVERRVYQLLSEKYHVFEDYFGASDTVLGTLGHNNDLERELLNIYINCRTPQEIDSEFEKLQEKFEEENKRLIKESELELIRNFDEEVAKRFKITELAMKQQLEDIDIDFWELTKIVLDKFATFFEEDYSFCLYKDVFNNSMGRYRLSSKQSKNDENSFTHRPYKLNSELGQWVINYALKHLSNKQIVRFDLSGHEMNISGLEPYKNQKGVLKLTKLKLMGLVDEDELLMTAVLENGEEIPTELVSKLFKLNAKITGDSELGDAELRLLGKRINNEINFACNKFLNKNNVRVMNAKKMIMQDASNEKKCLEFEIVDLKNKISSIEERYLNTNKIEELNELRKEQIKLEGELIKKERDYRKKENDINKRRDNRDKEVDERIDHISEEVFTIQFEII